MKHSRNAIADLFFDEKESILHILLMNSADFTIDSASIYDAQITEITGGKPYLALIGFSDSLSIDHDTLKFITAEPTLKKRIAAAYYNPNLANRLTVEAFRHLKNPVFQSNYSKPKRKHCFG